MELFANNAQTTLNGSISSGAISLVVTSAAAFPATGNFHILVDAEIFLVTGVSGSTFTVTPGQEGTTQSSHSSGATVTQVLSNAGLQNFRADTNSRGVTASLPTVGTSGRIYLATDGVLAYQDNGSSWQAFGPLYPCTSVVAGNFSWVNQSTATITTANGMEVLTTPGGQGSSDSIHMRVESAPSTPYSITMGFKATYPSGASAAAMGMCFRNSSSGKLTIFFFNGNVQVLYFTSPTAFSSSLSSSAVVSQGSPHFFRIQDDGANRIYQYSFDGFNFVSTFSEVRTTNFTADQVGFFNNPNGDSSGKGSALSVFHYTH